MKGLFLCFAVLFMTAFAFGQNVQLSGVISNRHSDTIAVSYYDNPISYTQKTFKTFIDRNGAFSLPITVPRPFTECSIIYGDDEVDFIVSPGTSVRLQASGGSFINSLHFTGKDSLEANFVAQHMREKEKLFSSRRKTEMLSKMPVDQIDSAVFADMQDEFNYLEVYGKGSSPSFKYFWRESFRYSAYAILLAYPLTRFSYLKRMNPAIAIKRDDQNLARVPDLYNDSLIESGLYQRYLYKYVNMKLMLQGLNADSICNVIFQTMPPKSAAYASAWFIYHSMATKPLEQNAPLLSAYKVSYPLSPYTPTLDDYYNASKRLAPGMPAVDFSFKTIEGQSLKLSDLKGKVVVIDFWASWCRPCIAMLPAMRTMQEHFAGKQVVFLYISLDDNESAWKAAIATHQLTGLHILAEPGALDKLYNVTGIPTSFLIDREGKIVKQPEHEEKISDVIERLLI